MPLAHIPGRVVLRLTRHLLRLQLEALEARMRHAEGLAVCQLSLCALLHSARVANAQLRPIDHFLVADRALVHAAQCNPVRSTQLRALLAVGLVGTAWERNHALDPHQKNFTGLVDFVVAQAAMQLRDCAQQSKVAGVEVVLVAGIRIHHRIQLRYTRERAQEHVSGLVGCVLAQLKEGLVCLAVLLKHVDLVCEERGSSIHRILTRCRQAVDAFYALLVPLHVNVVILGAPLGVLLEPRIVALLADADQTIGSEVPALRLHEVHQKLVDGVVLVGQHEDRRDANRWVGSDPVRADDDQRSHDDHAEVRLASARRSLGEVHGAAHRVDERQQLTVIERRLLQQRNQLGLQTASQCLLSLNLDQWLQCALGNERRDQVV
eukprot:635551-Rhodomonas_salina.2